MTITGWIQIALFSVIMILITRPLGGYMTRVFSGERTFLSPILRPVERAVYWCCGVDEKEEQHWLTYAVALLFFSVVGFVSLYALQRLQWYLPFNPQGQTGGRADLAFNTSVSFVTNTNWQAYSGETTMGYLVQMAGLTVHNFVSAATGIALALALIRGFVRREAKTIGNFWVDLTRCTLYILIPISVVGALVLVWLGVPQNLGAYTEATTLEGAKQVIAQGPVASQEIIKELGTNGGGFFNANSSHPFENPNPLTNLIELLAIFAIGAALTNVLGRMVKDERQGWAIFAAMGLLFLAGVTTAYWSELHGNPAFAQYNVEFDGQRHSNRRQHGRQRGAVRPGAFGLMGHGDDRHLVRRRQFDARQLPADRRHGADGQHAARRSHLWRRRLRPLRHPRLRHRRDVRRRADGRAHARISRQEARGQGGQNDDPRAFEPATVDPRLDRAGDGLAAGPRRHRQYRAARLQRDPLRLHRGHRQQRQRLRRAVGEHAVLQPTIAGAMLIGRFIFVIPLLAVAGSLAQKKLLAPSAGTFPTNRPLFVGLLIGVILIIGGLTYFPAISLGPAVEQVAMNQGKLYPGP